MIKELRNKMKNKELDIGEWIMKVGGKYCKEAKERWDKKHCIPEGENGLENKEVDDATRRSNTNSTD